MKTLRIFFLMLLCSRVLYAAPADDQPKEKGMLDRLMRFYSWNDPKAPKTSFQGKMFQNKGEFTAKKFAAGDYAGVKSFGSKDFGTKTYADSGKSWLGKIFPSRKLPDNLQGNNRDGSRRFDTGTFATKDFDPAKKSDPYVGRETFATRQAVLKGKTQGSIDNDQKLQESIRKGLTIDDVKRLLNKPGAPSN
jgi:hypothetical protein